MQFAGLQGFVFSIDRMHIISKERILRIKCMLPDYQAWAETPFFFSLAFHPFFRNPLLPFPFHIIPSPFFPSLSPSFFPISLSPIFFLLSPFLFPILPASFPLFPFPFSFFPFSLPFSSLFFLIHLPSYYSLPLSSNFTFLLPPSFIFI